MDWLDETILMEVDLPYCVLYFLFILGYDLPYLAGAIFSATILGCVGKGFTMWSGNTLELLLCLVCFV